MTDNKLEVPHAIETEDESRTLTSTVTGLEVLTLFQPVLDMGWLRFYAFRARNVLAIKYSKAEDTIIAIKIPCTKESAITNLVKNKDRIVHYLDEFEPKWRNAGIVTLIDTDRGTILSPNDFYSIFPTFLTTVDTCLFMKFDNNNKPIEGTVYTVYSPDMGAEYKSAMIIACRVYFKKYLSSPSSNKMYPDTGKRLVYKLILSQLEKGGYPKFGNDLTQKYVPTLDSDFTRPYGHDKFKFDALDNISFNIKKHAVETVDKVEKNTVLLTQVLATGVDFLIKEMPDNQTVEVEIDTQGDIIKSITIENKVLYVTPVKSSTTIDQLRTMLDSDVVILRASLEEISAKDKEVQDDIDAGFEGYPYVYNHSGG